MFSDQFMNSKKKKSILINPISDDIDKLKRWNRHQVNNITTTPKLQPIFHGRWYMNIPISTSHLHNTKKKKNYIFISKYNIIYISFLGVKIGIGKLNGVQIKFSIFHIYSLTLSLKLNYPRPRENRHHCTQPPDRHAVIKWKSKMESVN